MNTYSYLETDTSVSGHKFIHIKMPPTSKPIRLLADGIYNILAINSFLFEDHGYKNKKESGGYFL